jgi:hypothetical protein
LFKLLGYQTKKTTSINASKKTKMKKTSALKKRLAQLQEEVINDENISEIAKHKYFDNIEEMKDMIDDEE